MAWLLLLACTSGRGVAVTLSAPDTGLSAPEVTDLWPEDAAVFSVGEDLRLRARVSHPELPVDELAVEATLDGAPVTGWSMTADGGWTMEVPVVSGLHELVLGVTDPLGVSATGTMAWQGNTPPEVQLHEPVDEQVYGALEPIATRFTLDDLDGDTLAWAWEETGEVLAEGSLDVGDGATTVESTLPTLPEGIHELALVTSDGHSTVSVGVRVRVRTD